MNLEIPNNLIAVLGVLAKAVDTAKLAVEDQKILDAFLRRNTCSNCGRVGWHSLFSSCGWNTPRPWDEEE